MYATHTFPVVKRPYAIGLLDVNATASARTSRTRGSKDEPLSAAECAALDAWARRAAMANGFGDAAVAPSAYELMHVARADRSHAMSTAIGDVARRFVRTLTAAVAQWRARRLAYATARDLGGLDTRTLRDIGFDRSELLSVAYEVAGLSERQRVRALRSPK